MWTDPIVAELHRLRERHAREFGYDLRRMFQDLKKQQESCGRRIVSVPRKRTMTLARVKS
jgi:hypothetical protein